MAEQVFNEEKALNLLPAKHVKKIDWSRCIICQEKNKTKLRTATESSISKFIDAINIQQDECYELLKYDINKLCEYPIVCHSICMPSMQVQKI